MTQEEMILRLAEARHLRLQATCAEAQAAMIEAAVQEDLMRAEVEGPEPSGCPHPKEMRKDISTMGHSGRYQCLQCGEVIEPGGSRDGSKGID